MNHLKTLLFFILIIGTAAIPSSYADDKITIQQAMDYLMNGKEGEFRKIALQLSEHGDLPSQTLYGRFLMQKGEYAEAEKWLKVAADKGYAEAQFHLSGLYFSSTPPRNTEGEKWLQSAAAQGHQNAKDIIEDRSNAPTVINGMISVEAMAKYMERFGLRNISRLNDDQISCYAQSKDVTVNNFIEAGKTCIERLTTKYGAQVKESDSPPIAQEFVTCSNYLVVEKNGTTYQELYACLKNKEKP